MPSIAPYRSGYRAQVAVHGQRDSATFRTKREATAWAHAREAELRAHVDAPIVETHTLADAMRKYGETVSPHKRGARWELLRMASMLDEKKLPCASPIADVTPAILGVWRDYRLTQVSAGTVLREIGLLSAIFETARREWQWISVNPVTDVRKPRAPDHREVVITRGQIRRMLSGLRYAPGVPIRTVSHAVALCFLVALRTGMRAGELCALTWDDVFDGYCKIRDGKTGKRDVSLTKKTTRLIDAMRGYDPVYVFGLKPNGLDAMFRKYRDRAGLSGFTFHDSRHTAATWLAQKIHVLDMCKMFGWRSTTRALTYYNPSATDIARRIDAIPAKRGV
jgi:integrase